MTPQNIAAAFNIAACHFRNTAYPFGKDEVASVVARLGFLYQVSLLYTNLLEPLRSGVAGLHAIVLHIPGIPCGDLI
jgi:hypothetical protein